MLQRGLTAIGLKKKASARAQQCSGRRSLGSNAKILREAAPPLQPKTTTSSSAMMKMKPRKPSDQIELLTHLNTYFPINPPRYDLDERTMTNVQWRESGRAVDTAHMMEFYGITPDLLQQFQPRINLVVQWPQTNVTSYRGNKLTPTEVKSKPDVKFSVKGRLWTLMMTDPDAPTPENGKEFLHWMIVNIPGQDISKGETLVDYLGAAPPQLSRYHRYVFILAEQKHPINPVADGVVTRASSTSGEGRFGFNTRDFMKKYNLSAKGVSFFHAQWDESVPETHKTIGFEIDLSKKKTEEKIDSSKRYSRM